MLANSRLIAAALLATWLAGPVAVCAGWHATPEARMACCLEGGECAMHPSEGQDGIGSRTVTQAEADSCCAASEPDASPTAKLLAANLAPPATGAPAVLLPPVIARSAAWDRRAPDRAVAVPRNILLSVFII